MMQENIIAGVISGLICGAIGIAWTAIGLIQRGETFPWRILLGRTIQTGLVLLVAAVVAGVCGAIFWQLNASPGDVPYTVFFVVIGFVISALFFASLNARRLIAPEPITISRGIDPRLELRQTNGVRKLTDLEDGTPMDEISDGVYGFDIPWADPQSEDRTLSQTAGGTAELEIHKLSSGEILLVGYVSTEHADIIRSNSPSPVDIVMYTRPSPDALTLVAIPTCQIARYDDKRGGRTTRIVMQVIPRIPNPEEVGPVGGNSLIGEQNQPMHPSGEVNPVEMDDHMSPPGDR